MSSKLDPGLRATLESGRTAKSSSETVEVIVALRAPADEAALADLAKRGLSVRSVIGDILTGTVALTALDEVAASPLVVQIEGSRRLFPE